jgi:prophage tail gpP-like protein
MALEIIEFRVAGKALPFTDCSLSSSAEEAVRNACFSVAWTGAGIPCTPDDEATITISGTLWGTGHVRDVRGAHDAGKRGYDVTFVSRTCDATECSVDHPTGLKRDADLGEIAKEFDTLGIGIEGTAKTSKKPVHKVRPGETLFDTLETDARSQGILIHDTPTGRLKLADKPEGRHAGALVRGVNILSAEGNCPAPGAFPRSRCAGSPPTAPVRRRCARRPRHAARRGASGR